MKLTQIIEESYANVNAETVRFLHTSKYTKKILDAYKAFLAISKAMDNKAGFLKNVQKYIGTTDTSIYSQEDITAFCFQLESFESYPVFYTTGNFLSQLINDHYKITHEEKEYILVTNHLREKMYYLCEENNGANIRVRGSAGPFFGTRMKEGTIILEGNSESHLGNLMEGGTIQVLGDGGTSCGDQLFGGNITIEGDVKNLIAQNMFGGVIEVKGHVGTDIGINMRGGLLKFHEDITGKISHSINTRDPPCASIQVNGKRII